MTRVITEAFPASAEINLESVIAIFGHVLKYKLEQAGDGADESKVKEDVARQILEDYRDTIPGDDHEAKIQYLLDSVSK